YRVTTDRLARYNPEKAGWTFFDYPLRGTEIRHVSLLERDGVTKVIVPLYRDSQMGAMTLRSEAEIAALKAQGKERRSAAISAEALPSPGTGARFFATVIGSPDLTRLQARS